MTKRLLFLVLLFIAGAANAQHIASVSAPRSAKSIIVKLKQGQPVSGLLLQTFDKLSNLPGAYPALFPTQNSDKTRRQSVGLDRIIQIKLREGLNAWDAVQLLRGNPALEYVEPNYIFHIDQAKPAAIIPADSLFDQQWWLKNIHAPEAWEVTEGDSTVRIGFVDTGVEWFHPELIGQFSINAAEDINHNGLFDPWPSTEVRRDAHGNMVTGDLDGIDQDGNGYADDVIGYDFVDQESINIGDWSGRDPIPEDQNGHGTSVAGVLAAEQGHHGISGVAPKCKLVALRAFDATGNAEDDDIASAIVYAADNNIRVLNLSFGDIVPSLMQRDAIRYATSRGTLVFASSGNSGGDDPHYPSDFDEVVSVGGTSDYPFPDAQFSLTTHGEGMDIEAPGQNVLTTTTGGGYAAVAGTSVSSPIAAGVAALLASKRPGLTPLELRSILESTTQDISTLGYDHFSANGRVDAAGALKYLGSASIAITSPHTLDEFRFAEATIPVRGSAASALFTGYTLSYAKGAVPDKNNTSDSIWKPIQSGTSQVFDGLLGSWQFAGLDSGAYTLRLAVHSSDNRSTEQRTVVHLYRAAPKFTLFAVDSIFVNERRGLLVLANSDIATQLEVRYSSGSKLIGSKSDDRFGLEHAVLIKREECPSATPITIQAILHASDGDSTIMTGQAVLLDEAVPQSGFVQKPYSLPAGFALDTALAMPGGDEVVESVFPDGFDFGPLKIFAFDGQKFKVVDSLNQTWIPRAIGNTQGDNKPELLLQLSKKEQVYKQNAQHSLLGDVVFNADYYAGMLADLDGDGKQEVLGYSDDTYYAHEYKGSYSLLGTMKNTSPTGVYNSRNLYAEPNVGIGDLQGTGINDVVTLDADADLVVFERDKSAPSGFRTIYTESNDGQAEGSLVTVGDFDGDGRPDIAYAYHSIFEQDTLGEVPPTYWTVKVLRNLGGLKFETIYSDHFYYARQLNPYRSSVRAIRNVTGHGADNLVLSLFPNFYLLEFDTAAKRMHPVWHYPVSVSANGALAYDFDRNGVREFGFVAGDSLRFFERDAQYSNRTPTPAGLNVTPRDTNRVDLDWASVKGATRYYVFRAGIGDPTFTLLDSSTVQTYSDSSVTNGDDWIYSVSAFAPSYKVPLSLDAFGIEAIVHPMPAIRSVTIKDATVVVHTTQPLRSQMLSAGAILIDGNAPESSVISSDSEVVLGLRSPLAAGIHTAQVVSFALRDQFNSPFDTSRAFAFTTRPDTSRDRFYIVRWNFIQNASGTQIHVTFNEPPADEALNVQFYSLSPFGTLTSVTRDPSDANSLIIDLAEAKFSALGVPFVLCIHDIFDKLHTALDTNATNCVGVTFTEPNLDNVMVYPNPAKLSDASVTFARLTAQATIKVYTLNMKFVRELSTSAQEGGVTWDMRDNAGRLMLSGEYLYYVTGRDDAGIDVPGKASKFVLVNDNK